MSVIGGLIGIRRTDDAQIFAEVEFIIAAGDTPLTKALMIFSAIFRSAQILISMSFAVDQDSMMKSD